MEENEEQSVMPVQETITSNEAETVVVNEPEEVVSNATLVKLITDLHTVLDDARNIIAKYNQKSAALEQREKDVLFREVTVDSRSKDLVAREEACKRVENVLQMSKDAGALMDSANLRLNAAVEAERSLRQVTQEETSKLSELRLETQKEANALEAQKKRIDDEVSKRVSKILYDMGINTKVDEPPPSV